VPRVPAVRRADVPVARISNVTTLPGGNVVLVEYSDLISIGIIKHCVEAREGGVVALEFTPSTMSAASCALFQARADIAVLSGCPISMRPSPRLFITYPIPRALKLAVR